MSKNDLITAVPFRLALAGAGGFAVFITDLLLRSGHQCQPPIRLVGVAEPNASIHRERLAELGQQGIATVSQVDELLADPSIEAIWLPLPISLHRPFTERALAAGKAVLVEKPAAGTIQDVDAMIAARDRARLPVTVAFQHMYDPLTAQLKERIVAGQMGTVRHAVLHACWPRTEQYYRRSSWAGQFKQGNAWVMDSPANNALAHYLNLALFFLGTSFAASARPEHLEAELYRAHDIENFDTISLRLHFSNGATLLVLLTHACRDYHGPVLNVEGTQGRLSWTTSGADWEVQGQRERLEACPDPERRMVERFARQVRGFSASGDLECTLETARAQLLVANAASEATPIVPVPAPFIEHFVQGEENGVTVTGLPEAIIHCASRGQMLHESGLLPFSRPAGRLDLRSYHHFSGPHLGKITAPPEPLSSFA